LKFNFKEYQNQKIIRSFKNKNLLFFSINANLKSRSWIKNEQKLKEFELNYYKIYNNVSKKIIKKSIFFNMANIITSTFFFIIPNSNYTQINNKIFQYLNSIYFTILAIKLNNKIYNTNQIKKIMTFNYKKNVSILYQFLQTNIKVIYVIKSLVSDANKTK